MKVLLVLDHAPDYREPFLKELGKYVDLCVVAQPCEKDGLFSPATRSGYEYFETPSIRFGGLYWQSNLSKILRHEEWDVVCVDINLRHISRLYQFFKLTAFKNRWIWRGLIFGNNDNLAFNTLRKFFLQRSAACLVYSDEVEKRVFEDLGVKAVSFNNTEVKRDEFRNGNFDSHSEIRLLFVGTYKPRKKLERLIELAKRRNDISIRIVGPGMDKIELSADMKNLDRLKIFGRTIGNGLINHFDWADLVVSPGNVGLLVMNAARHGKGIVIDNDSYHGPEHWLAKKTGQPFISFDNAAAVDRFIDYLKENRKLLKEWGIELQTLAKEKYTIEYMAETHYKVFKQVAARAKKSFS